MSEENWRDTIERKLKSGLLTEEEARAISEIMKMYHVLLTEIRTSAGEPQAIKRFAVWIRDLEEIALTQKPCFYIYRGYAALYRTILVDLVIEMFPNGNTS